MRVLLDTSAYSAFMRGHEGVQSAIRASEEILFNSIVLGELTAGFIRGKQRRKNEAELQRFFASPRVGLLDITDGTAERYAVILNGLWQLGTPMAEQ